MLEVLEVPASFGVTTCEYSVGCKRETNLVATLPVVGTIPMCKVHIHFYNNN